MTHTDQLRAWASEIKEAQDKGQQIAPFTSRIGNFDLPTAYAVAHLAHEERLGQGAVPVGRKIGFTNPDMWSIYGVCEPIWAYVYDQTVVHLGKEPAACAIGRFAEPKIEPEIVLHFRTAPPPGGTPEAILECIDWVAHGFEIVQSHYPGWKFQAADTVADWALHGTLLVGEPQPTENLGPHLAAQLEQLRLSLYCDGALWEVGRGANVLGSPLLAIAHLVSVLHRHPDCEPIQPGELVTTGTVTTAHPVRPGERWSTRIDGIALPGVSVEFLSADRPAKPS